LTEPPASSVAAAGFPPSGGTLAAQRGQRGSASEISTYVRQDGHAAARITGGVVAGRLVVSASGERLRFPQDEDDEVDADDVVGVADDDAAARSRADRTMSRVQTAAEVVIAGGGTLRSWLDSWTLGWRVRNVLPDCKKSNKI
jgi:hypothetical protein